jgi:hypothetical protein
MGGGGKNKQKQDNPYGDAIEKYTNQTAGLRKTLAKRYQNFVTGEDPFDVTQMPTYWPMRNQADDAYAQANEQIIGNMAPGGGMGRSLANSSLGRARSISDIGGSLGADFLNKAHSMATGSILPSTQLASSQLAANAQESAGKSGALGGLGQGVGYVLGSGKGSKNKTPAGGGSSTPWSGTYGASTDVWGS